MEEIKATDIMIGNWVYYKFFNPNPKNPDYSYTKVRIVGVYKDTFHFNFPNRKEVTKIKELFPIPITEEILLKAGGIKKRASLYDDDYVYSFGNISILAKWDENGCSFIFDKMDIQIQYLHQLQNLFKSLTGNDLNVEV